jgi:hypothetical protein
LDVFGICANGAFEENLEMEMIYFWRDGEFITNEFTNMMKMFFDRRRCMLQRQSSWNRRSSTIACCMCTTAYLLCFRVFLCGKRIWEFAVTAIVFWGIRFYTLDAELTHSTRDESARD